MHMRSIDRLAAALGLLLVLIGQAAGAAGVAPLCPAMGAHGRRFPPGEMLSYKLDLLGAEMGTFEVNLEPVPAAERGKAILYIRTRAKTSAFVSTNMARIEAFATSLLGPDLLPLRYREDTDEGETHRHQEIDFSDRTTPLQVKATKDGAPEEIKLAATPSARDLISTLFVLRAMPLSLDTPVCLEVYAGRRLWKLIGKVAAKEQIETPLGTFATARVDLTSTRIDDPKVVRTVHLWLSDDARRLPVAALAEVRGRTIRAQLSGTGDTALAQKRNARDDRKGHAGASIGR